MRILSVLFVTLAACGGSTAADSSTPTSASSSPDVCAAIADSGVSCFDCVAQRCCAELTACTNDAEGKAYETCLANCAFDRDAGGCESSCAARHPAGASACGPYMDCIENRCFAVGCK